MSEHTRTLHRRAAHLQLAATSPARSAAKLALLLAVAATAAAAAVWIDRPAAWVVYVVVSAAVLTSLFAVEHEALHTSLFGHRWADHLVGTFCGVLCAAPYASYRAFHFEHHIRTHEQGDPEPIVVVRSLAAHVGMVVFGILGLAAMLWGQLLATLAGHGPPWSRRVRRPQLAWTSLLAGVALPAVAVAVGVTVGWQLPLLLWVAPLAVFFPLAGFVSTTEHYGCDYGPAPAVRTSRTVKTSAPVRWLLWNANYHTAHHVLPGVPARNLPRLHELIARECEFVSESYLQCHGEVARDIRAGRFAPEPPWRVEAVEAASPYDAPGVRAGG